MIPPSEVISEYVNSYIVIIYPLTPQRNIEVTICKHQVDRPILCVVWCLIWLFASLKRSMVIHYTKCPYWDKVSLNNTNQPTIHDTHTTPWGRLKMATCTDAYYTCGLMGSLVICKWRKEYARTWHQMSILEPGVQQYKTQTDVKPVSKIAIATTLQVFQTSD